MMSEELKKIWNEIADETGWLAEREQAAVTVAIRETARKTAIETARKMLELGYSIEEISIVSTLTVEEVKELANTPVLVQ